MVANPDRRNELLDTALAVLGGRGGRALTHRAVDRAAGVPVGTCANYFPSRTSMFLGMAQRAFAQLAPDAAHLERLAGLEGSEAVGGYVEYAARRLLDRPQLALALVELKLEAGRSREVAEVLTPFLRDGFAADVVFHEEHGLPGDVGVVLTLHHLVEGLVLDQLTVPLAPEVDAVAEARARAEAFGRDR